MGAERDHIGLHVQAVQTIQRAVEVFDLDDFAVGDAQAVREGVFEVAEDSFGAKIPGVGFSGQIVLQRFEDLNVGGVAPLFKIAPQPLMQDIGGGVFEQNADGREITGGQFGLENRVPGRQNGHVVHIGRGRVNMRECYGFSG